MKQQQIRCCQCLAQITGGKETAMDHEPADDAVETESVVEFPGFGLARVGVAVFLGAAREADEVRRY